MDIFSHALWTNVLYGKARRYAWWGVAFGVLPDIISFGPFFLQRIFVMEDYSGRTEPVAAIGPSRLFGHAPELSEIPRYVFGLYNITHSLIIFLFVFLVVWGLRKAVWWPMLGWGFHVVIDIFTHTSKFFPTPFLWPVSNFKVSVISWGNPVFMAVNIAALIAVYGALYFFRRRRRMPAGYERNHSQY